MTPDGRRPYICGNWKMNNTAADTHAYFEDFLTRLADDLAVDVGVCVPFTSLAAALDARGDAPVRIAAQNMHQDSDGAFTGEVSAPMLVELQVDDVVLGHSERRQHFCENDRDLQEKVPAALEAGLQPILCVGETEEEREADETQRKLRHQVGEALEQVPPDRLSEVVIAYEPVWAIGSGKSATAEQAQEAVAFVRALVGDRSKEAAEAMRVLYGGSVKPGENAEEILGQPDVDGALVGGASLEPDGFVALIEAAGS